MFTETHTHKLETWRSSRVRPRFPWQPVHTHTHTHTHTQPHTHIHTQAGDLAKFARKAKVPVANQYVNYKKQCRAIWDRQVASVVTMTIE